MATFLCENPYALNRQIERYTTLKVQAAANPNVLADGLYFLSDGRGIQALFGDKITFKVLLML